MYFLLSSLILKNISEPIFALYIVLLLFSIFNNIFKKYESKGIKKVPASDHNDPKPVWSL